MISLCTEKITEVYRPGGVGVGGGHQIVAILFVSYILNTFESTFVTLYLYH